MRVIWQSVAVTAVVLVVGLAAAARDDEPGKMNPVSDPAPATPVKQVGPVDPVKPVDPPPVKPVELKEPAPGKSKTVIRGAGNGWGNTIVVDNGGTGRGTTVIQNSRNGFGNRVVVIDGKVVTDVPGVGAKDLRFGDVKFYSVLHGCTVYWDPKTTAWYRYDNFRERYVPAEWDADWDD